MDGFESNGPIRAIYNPKKRHQQAGAVGARVRFTCGS